MPPPASTASPPGAPRRPRPSAGTGPTAPTRSCARAGLTRSGSSRGARPLHLPFLETDLVNEELPPSFPESAPRKITKTSNLPSLQKQIEHGTTTTLMMPRGSMQSYLAKSSGVGSPIIHLCRADIWKEPCLCRRGKIKCNNPDTNSVAFETVVKLEIILKGNSGRLAR